MDKLDAKILEQLQNDGGLTAAEIADRVGLSKAPCWRRIQKLQQQGVIRHTVALLDAHALNVGTTVFVTLKTGNHSEAWFEQVRGCGARHPRGHGDPPHERGRRLPDPHRGAGHRRL